MKHYVVNVVISDIIKYEGPEITPLAVSLIAELYHANCVCVKNLFVQNFVKILNYFTQFFVQCSKLRVTK